MSEILRDLDRIKGRISDSAFLNNKGLSNEVGIHVFCYDPSEEMTVQDYVRRLKAEANTPYHIIECDLYEIFLSLLEDKRVLGAAGGDGPHTACRHAGCRDGELFHAAVRGIL